MSTEFFLDFKSLDTAIDAVQKLKPPSSVEAVLLVLACLFVIAFKSQGKLWDRPDPNGKIYFDRPQLQDGGRLDSKSESRDIAEQLDSLDKHMVIFWGSQSGTAETLAHRLARDLHLRFGLNVMTADLSDYDPASLTKVPTSKLAIFMLSTYGEGGPSDNTIAFWDWICRGKGQDFSKLRFMAFGLGNSNYKYYNKVVHEVTEKLRECGATLMMPVGQADEATASTEEDYLAWLDELHLVLENQLHFQPKPIAYTPALRVEEASGSPLDDLESSITAARDQGKPSQKSTSAIKPLRLLSSVDLSEQPQQWNCLHMELDLTDQPELRYKTGDHLAVWPVNPEMEVNRLLKILGREEVADVPLRIESTDDANKAKISSPTTPRLLFHHQLEICGSVARDLLIGLCEFAPTEEARTMLSRLGSSREAFAEFRANNFVTLGSLLEHATSGVPWTKIPLSYVIESIPALQPRYYSISSSSVLSPRRLTITVSVSNTPLPAAPSVTIPGLATNYLFAAATNLLSPGSTSATTNPRNHLFSEKSLLLSSTLLQTQIRRTNFKPPTAVGTPLIMIANGTGIAPFRAFILERAKLHSIGRNVGVSMLFFGCRRPDSSYLYREELETAQRTLNSPRQSTGESLLQKQQQSEKKTDDRTERLVINTAFSRLDENHPNNRALLKGYVQALVQREAATLIDLLTEQGASMYICGGAAMAREVGLRLGSAYAATKGVDAEEAAEWVAAVKRRGKWKEDVWS